MGCGASVPAQEPAEGKPTAAPVTAADKELDDAAALIQAAAVSSSPALEVVDANPEPPPRAAGGAFDPSKYRARCVAFGLPEGGFTTMMAATVPYFTSGEVAMPEGVFQEWFLTTPDETKQFIILLFEAKAEEAIKAQYGATPEDEAWKAMEAGAKEYGMMADPVQFTYMDGATLFGGTTSATLPAPGSAMPALAGWPVDFPPISGAIVQTDAPVSAKGAYENVAFADKWAATPAAALAAAAPAAAPAAATEAAPAAAAATEATPAAAPEAAPAAAPEAAPAAAPETAAPAPAE